MTRNADLHERIRRRAAGLRARERPPGDEAPPGSPQTGEHLCPACRGDGRRNGKPCPTCGGTGRVVALVGDA